MSYIPKRKKRKKGQKISQGDGEVVVEEITQHEKQQLL